MLKKITITILPLLALSFNALAAPQDAPQPIGFVENNEIATEFLHQALSNTGKATCSINDEEYDLTPAETQKLKALLAGVQSSTPLCAPDDSFYLNLLAEDGTWLMSLPAVKTPEGIVLLYLKLQGNNAGAPLQEWWKGVSARLGI